MAIAVVAVGTVATATTGTANPGLPAGWAADHIHVLVVESENEPVPTMTGWSNVGAGVINVATGTVTSLTIRWRRAVAGDVAPTVPATGTGVGTHSISRIIGFSGCVTTGDPWDVTLFGTEAVADTTVSFPNPANTTQTNDMVVHVFTTGQDVNTAQSSGAGTNANLTGLANRMNNWTNAGGGGGFAMITGIKATAGSIGATTTTVTTANVKALFTGALKEAPAAAWAPTSPVMAPRTYSYNY
jgi:hypothetical protein